MLARTSLDAQSLTEILGSNARQTKLLHREVIKTLHEHGILTLSGDGDGKELLAAIKGLDDPSLVAVWTSLLRYLQNNHRLAYVEPKCESTTAQWLDSGDPEYFGKQTDVVVVREAVGEREGFSVEGHVRQVGQPEKVLADALNASEIFSELSGLRMKGRFPAGTDRERFWSDVLAPLSRVSSEVTVFDRYLFSSFSRRRGLGGHVRWLLERLDGTLSDNSTVRLLADAPTGGDINDLQEALQREAKRQSWTRLRHLEVWLAPWHGGKGKGPHNRHVRFSCGSAVTFEEGLDRLEFPKLSYAEGINWKYVTDSDVVLELAVSERYVGSHPAKECLYFSLGS